MLSTRTIIVQRMLSMKSMRRGPVRVAGVISDSPPSDDRIQARASHFKHEAGSEPTDSAQNQGIILDAIRDHAHTARMTRVTGKFQITLPKRLVDAFGIRVGDEVELVAAGDAIRIVPANA